MADFLDAVPGGSQMIENIPPQYQDDLLGTSLQSRPGVDLEAVGQILLLLAGLILFSALLSYLQNFLMSSGRPKDLLPAAGSDQPQDEQTASQLLR